MIGNDSSFHPSQLGVTVEVESSLLSTSGSEGQGQFSIALGHQRGPKQQPRPGMSKWPLVVTWAQISTQTPADTGPQTQTCLSMAAGAKYLTMALGDSIDYTHQVFLTTHSSTFLSLLSLYHLLAHLGGTWAVWVCSALPTPSAARWGSCWFFLGRLS